MDGDCGSLRWSRRSAARGIRRVISLLRWSRFRKVVPLGKFRRVDQVNTVCVLIGDVPQSAGGVPELFR